MSFDLRKYLAEGRLYENESPLDQYVKTLEDELGVKVAASDYNPKGDRLTVYPDHFPGTDRNYNSRTSQKIHLEVRDGKYFFSNAYGHDMPIEYIARLIGKYPESSSIIGMSSADSSLDKPEISIAQLKRFVTIMQKGLEDEARAQSDFYRDRTPD